MAEIIDTRYMVVAGDEYTPSVRKKAVNVFRYHISYTGWLAGEDTLVSGTATVDGPLSPPTVAVPAVFDSGNALRFLVTGGSAGWIGKIHVDGTTTGGQVKRFTFSLEITA